MLLLERYFKTIFVIPSGLGVFLRGKYLIMFFSSPSNIGCSWDESSEFQVPSTKFVLNFKLSLHGRKLLDDKRIEILE